MRTDDVRSSMSLLEESDLAALRAECTFFYRCMFGRDPTDRFIQYYLDVHTSRSELCTPEFLNNQSVKVIKHKKLNAVHIEPWLRKPGKNHPLSAKLLVITYVAECDATHSEFSRSATGIVLGKFHLFFRLVVAAFQLMHGYILVKRYGLH